MANPFDRFDAPAPSRGGSNPFDRFDRDDEHDDGKTTQTQAFFRSAADSATLGAGDEIAGGIEATRAALTGGNAGDAYRRRVAQARENLRRAREDRPLESFAGSLVGGSATFLVPGVGAVARGGKALQAAAAGRGAKALAAQMAQGARGGAVFGGLYGMASGEDDVESRVRSGLSGAAWGAGAGAAFVPIAQGVGRVAAPVVEPAKRAVDGVRNRMIAARSTIASDRSGSAQIPPRSPPAAPPPDKGEEVVARRVDALLGRGRKTTDDFEGAVNDARAAPAGRVIADVVGDDAQAKTKALVAAPGQTSGRAREVADARAHALPTRLIDEMNAGMGVRSTPTQARKALANEYRETSKTGYAPTLAQDVAPQDMQRLAPIIQRFPERVREKAAEVMQDLARIDGVDPAAMTGAQKLHYLKMALDDATMALESQEGLRAGTRGALRRLKGEFLEVIEGNPDMGVPPIIPGYREARQKWGSLHDAEEALEEGARAFQMRPEEVADVMAQMGPFQREHFRIAVADEAAKKLMRAGREVGQTNAANALNSRELQDVLRVAFDDPAQAAKFLDRLNEGNRLMRNASGWGAGSDTVSKASQLADEGVETLIEGAADAAGHPITAAKNAAIGGVRLFTGPQAERQRNALGKALLTAIDDGDDEAAAFIQRLIANLRKRDAARAERGANAGRDGALGGIGGGGLDDASDF